MRIAIPVQFVVSVIILTGCSSPAPEVVLPQPEFDPAIAKAWLDSSNKHYDDRFRDSTEAWFAQRYTNDACVMSPNMPRVCGVPEITKFYWNNGDSRTITLDIKGEEVSGKASEITEVGNYRVIDDEGTVLDAGKFMATYRSDGNAWKVHREIWNSDLDPNAEVVADTPEQN